MLNRTLLGIAILAVFMVVPVIAGPATGCNKIKFTGSYMRPVLVDVFEDGTVVHKELLQLNISADGSAVQNFSGTPDYMMTFGTQTSFNGSWTCRADGKLIVTLITALYDPLAAGSNPQVTSNDLTLAWHLKSTYLYSVDDVNTLTRVSQRNRWYSPDQDPSDAAGGSLTALVSTPVSFKRLVATDDDLLAP